LGSSLSFERLNGFHSFTRLRQAPVFHQLFHMEFTPLAHQSQNAAGQCAMEELASGDIDLPNMVAIDCVKMSGWMVVEIDTDGDSVEIASLASPLTST
jgi:hypothetical protein